MKFDNETLNCHFTLPDLLTLRHVEAWEGGRLAALAEGAKTKLSVNWMAAVAIIEDWECEALPDYRIGSGVISNEQLAIIAWVGAKVERHILELTAVPKN